MRNKATSDKGDAAIAAADIAPRCVAACFVLRTSRAPRPTFCAWSPLSAVLRPQSNAIAAQQASKDHRAESKGLTCFPGTRHLGDVHTRAVLTISLERNPARASPGAKRIRALGTSRGIGGQQSRPRSRGASRRGAAWRASWLAHSGRGCRLSSKGRRA